MSRMKAFAKFVNVHAPMYTVQAASRPARYVLTCTIAWSHVPSLAGVNAQDGTGGVWTALLHLRLSWHCISRNLAGSHWRKNLCVRENQETVYPKDRYAMAVLKDVVVIGHLPRPISRVSSLFLRTCHHSLYYHWKMKALHGLTSEDSMLSSVQSWPQGY